MRYLLISLLLLCRLAKAQDYKGIWQGYITAHESYLSGYSINILQQEGDIIKGKGYLYHNKLFNVKGRFDFIGTISGNICKITELKIVDSLVQRNSAFLCLKLMNLELVSNNNLDYLVGNWHGDIYTNENCIPGKVYLRRNNPSDINGIEPIPEHALTALQKESPVMTFKKTELAKPFVLTVNHNILTISIRDYLREDFDTVSVYFNRNQIIKKLALTKKPKLYTIRLDKLSGLNEIILYAENLGQVPPNTSTLIISDGVKKQTVTISSTLQQSAVIYLKYEPAATASK